MHTSKYGSSVLITSPSKTSSRFASGLPCTRFVTSLAILGSSSTAMTFLAFSRILTVMLPVPGPTSRTIWTISAAWYAQTPQETDIALLEICLIHNCLSYPWILEYMLADVRLHLKDVIGGGFFAPVVVRAAVSSAIALPSGRFGHDALRVTIASNIHLEESNGSSHKSQLLLHRVRRSWQTRIAKCQKFVLRLIDKPGHASKFSAIEPHRSSRPQFHDCFDSQRPH